MIKRTDKKISKETIDIDFMRKAVAILCSTSEAVKLPEKSYTIEERYVGKQSGTSVNPWNNGLIERGYTKELGCISISIDGFCYLVLIFQDGNGMVLSENSDRVFNYPSLKWVNFMIEHGFYELKIITKINDLKIEAELEKSLPYIGGNEYDCCKAKIDFANELLNEK